MPMKGQFDGRGQWDGASRTLATSHRLASSLPMKATKRQRSTGCSPEVLWSGHFYDLSGYGKMNRELLFRVANTIRIGLHRGGIAQEVTLIDPLTKARLDAHASETVGEKSPLLQVYTPVMDVKGRHRICYTMMETQRLHADFISRLNAMYEEVWFPTAWNLDVAKDSGLKIPGRVMPLGVNSFVFHPKEERPILPKCLLQTTSRIGVHESPEGFVFIFSGVPTFRKGYDVLLSAFEDAFAGDADAALVLFTTYSRIATARYDPWEGGAKPKDRKAKVYELTGMFTEHELAEVYNGCDCYVCASRGEGWDLPLSEGASCGLPCIAPLAYSHHEFMDEKTAFMFHPDGYEPIPDSKKISHWYEDMPFAAFHKKAHDDLVDLMRYVKKNPAKAKERGALLMNRLHTSFSWEIAADRVTRRLLEVQP